MASKSGVEIKGLRQTVELIDSVGGSFYAPLLESTFHIRERIAVYPVKDKNAFSQTATPGQKRAYWTKVSKGYIDHREGVGYVRSGTLGRKWTSKVTKREGWVGNQTPYGRFVQGNRKEQQPFHKRSGWTRVADLARTERPKIIEIFQNHFKKIISKGGHKGEF